MDRYKDVQEKSRMPKQMPEIYSQEVMEYWKRRGIDYRIAIKERVYEFSMAKKPILGFPVYMNQTLVNVKYLNIRWQPGDEGPKWWQLNKDYGTNILPWGLQSLQFDPEEMKVILWTEGELDRLTWMTAGYKNVLSEPQGAPSINATDFKDKFAYLDDKYFRSVMDDVDRIIFSTDGDEPGVKLRNHLALMFGRVRCKFINYPVGYKDINEVWNGDVKKGLIALGQEGVDECFHNISSFPVRGIISPSHVAEDLERIAQNGFLPGLGIGMPELDKLYTVKQKRIHFVTGTPGAGKSTYVRWYTTSLITHNSKEDIKYALFTPENRPVAREFAKIAEVSTGQYFRRGWANSMSDDLRAKTMRFIEKHFFVVSPDRLHYETWGGKIKSDRINTMESILEYLMYLKKTEGVYGYIIDAWNKVEHEQPKNMTETSFISQQLDYLIDFNDVYDLHGCIVVHPRKIEMQGVNYKMPSLYDIKGSSAWKEKADVGIILHRYKNKRKPADEIPTHADEDDKYVVDPDAPTILRTEKIRFEEEGVEDRIKLRMDAKKGGRFFLYKEKEGERVEFPPISGKLNPAAKDDDDEVFVFNHIDDSNLPF